MAAVRVFQRRLVGQCGNGTLSVDSIEIEAPAKVNLFLEVVGRRGDGYHEIESIVQAISICDTLRVAVTSGSSTAFGCNVGELETGDNLAVRAAEAFRTATGFGGGVRIELQKRIPVEGGLGGGSSDAAAVLVALNELVGAGLDGDELRRLGAELGSDVPFFIEGGTALIGGRGERVEQLDVMGKMYYVVLCGGVGMSTGAVYKNLRLKLTRETESAKVLWGYLSSGNLQSAGGCLFNRLEESAFELDERLERLRDAMSEVLGGAGVRLSGSGGCLFSVFADKDGASEAYEAVRATNPGELFLVESVRRRTLSPSAKGDSRGNQ